MSDPSSKKFSWKKALVLVAAAGIVAASLSILFQVKGESVIQGFVAAEPSSMVHSASVSAREASSTATVGLGSSYNTSLNPVRLVIPAIGVDAAIQSVGLFWNGDGEMSIPTNFTDVAWYNGGPRPGMPGSAVIDGHLDGHDVKEAVFYRLGDLQPGDLVKVIDGKGNTFTFSVIRLADYNYNASTSDIFSSDTSSARLNLITCAGDWLPSQKLYNQRVVVFTKLISSDSSPVVTDPSS
jgi:hypothetical protein